MNHQIEENTYKEIEVNKAFYLNLTESPISIYYIPFLTPQPKVGEIMIVRTTDEKSKEVSKMLVKITAVFEVYRDIKKDELLPEGWVQIVEDYVLTIEKFPLPEKKCKTIKPKRAPKV